MTTTVHVYKVQNECMLWDLLSAKWVLQDQDVSHWVTSEKRFPTINLCWTIKFSVQCQQREDSAFRNQRKKKNIFLPTTYFIIYLIIVKQASTQLFTPQLSICIQWLFHCFICCRTKSLIRFLCWCKQRISAFLLIFSLQVLWVPFEIITLLNMTHCFGIGGQLVRLTQPYPNISY